MGENLLRFKPEYSPPQPTERSTDEITAQRYNELLQDSASNELQLELEIIAGLPEPRPDATPPPRSRASSPRLAHTLPRRRPSDAATALALPDADTRPVLTLPEQPLVAALQNLPPPARAPSNVPPSIEDPSSVPPPIEPHWSMPSRVGAPPKFPPAPRTMGDRLALPAMLFVLALGVGAFFLLQ